MQLRAALLGLAVIAWAPSALADDAADLATARVLGVDGVLLADAGKCREAIEKLTRAEALHHAPTTAGRLGECEIEVGKLVSGTERLNRVVREPLGANPPPVFLAAVARAQKVLDAALPRVATLRIALSAPPRVKVAIAIDGEPAPGAIVDSIRQIDPGTHRVEVTAPGYLPATGEATLKEGQTSSIALELEPDPRAAVPSEVRPVAAVEPVAAPSGPSAAPFVAFGVGALGLGVGIASAITVAHKSSVLDDACGANKVCPESRQSDIREAKMWATTSTVAFGVAGVGIVTGVVLLLTSHGAPARGVRPSVGVGTVSLHGAF